MQDEPMYWTVAAPTDLDPIATEMIRILAHRRKVLLYGEMGAGKTTFTKVFCRLLGVHHATSSPTFSIINAYEFTDQQGDIALFHHLDLYRLKSTQEALDIGIEDVLYDPWYCMIEWPQVIESILPPEYAVIRIELLEDGKRGLGLWVG
jgi:tRNA threonylcarbamoyladenosine biosynthesis protein TsaE